MNCWWILFFFFFPFWQAGKHEAIVKNVHDLLAKLAWDFSPEQLDHLFDCFKVILCFDCIQEMDCEGVCKFVAFSVSFFLLLLDLLSFYVLKDFLMCSSSLMFNSRKAIL